MVYIKFFTSRKKLKLFSNHNLNFNETQIDSHLTIVWQADFLTQYKDVNNKFFAQVLLKFIGFCIQIN